MADYLLSIKQVMSRTSLSRAAIYELIKRGDFPAQIPLMERRVGWSAEAVQAWIDNKINPTEQAA
jgi:prophage regulatory protein